jgi:hypothetical protein
MGMVVGGTASGCYPGRVLRHPKKYSFIKAKPGGLSVSANKGQRKAAPKKRCWVVITWTYSYGKHHFKGSSEKIEHGQSLPPIDTSDGRHSICLEGARAEHILSFGSCCSVDLGRKRALPCVLVEGDNVGGGWGIT